MAPPQTEDAGIYLQPVDSSIPRNDERLSRWLADLQRTVYPHNGEGAVGVSDGLWEVGKLYSNFGSTY